MIYNAFTIKIIRKVEQAAVAPITPKKEGLSQLKHENMRVF